jgi:hypothetical protein
LAQDEHAGLVGVGDGDAAEVYCAQAVPQRRGTCEVLEVTALAAKKQEVEASATGEQANTRDSSQ